MVADVRHPTAKAVKRWDEEFDENIRLSKACFFGDTYEGKKTLDPIRPDSEFQSLRKEWIEPLYLQIRDARSLLLRIPTRTTMTTPTAVG